MDFDETWHWWSTQSPLLVLLFSRQDLPTGADPGPATIGHGGAPSSKNFFIPEGFSNQPSA